MSNIAGIIMLPGFLVLFIFRDQFLPAMVFGITVIVGIGIIIPPYMKVKKAQKEAGMTSKDIRKALRK